MGPLGNMTHIEVYDTVASREESYQIWIWFCTQQNVAEGK